MRVCNIRRFYCFRELYEADFHKTGIYGSGRVWANAWDVFRRTPSQGNRGRRAAVDFVGGGSFFFFERTRPAANMRPPCLIYLSTSTKARPRKRSDRGFFLPIRHKSLFIPRSVQGSMLTRGTFPRMRPRGGRGRWADVGFAVCFRLGGIFSCFSFFDFFFLRTHTAYCKYEATSCLIYISTSNEARPR